MLTNKQAARYAVRIRRYREYIEAQREEDALSDVLVLSSPAFNPKLSAAEHAAVLRQFATEAQLLEEGDTDEISYRDCGLW